MKLAFQPTKFEEEGWLDSSLGGLAHAGWFEDVLFRVSSGKEATVYCCLANDWTGLELLAAKVYRPRQRRAMHNYHAYRQGRATTHDKRLQRAIANHSRAGEALQDTEWIKRECVQLAELHALGADVPQSLDRGETAMLMEYVGSSDGPAPKLSDVQIEADQAQPLFERLLANVELFLAHGLVHGDLSAYNVLLWDARPYIIDFPQAVDPTENPQAFAFLLRDVERVAQYCCRQGVVVDPEGDGVLDTLAIAERLWLRTATAGWEHYLLAYAKARPTAACSVPGRYSTI